MATQIRSRTAEILGALSLATDAAAGFPAETALRTSLIAVRLAKALDLAPAQLRDAFYAGLLRYLGCTAFAREHAGYNGGDDAGFLQIYADVDFGNLPQVMGRSLRQLGRNRGGFGRVGAVAAFLGNPGAGKAVSAAHCAAAVQLSGQIGLGAGVQAALDRIYERFDGRGAPAGVPGGQLGPVAKVLHLAQVAEVFFRLGGKAQAVAEVSRRAGGHLDPAQVAVFSARAEPVLAGLGAATVWEQFLEGEPGPVLAFDDAGLEAMALAFADFADLKSPWRIGHSRRVAGLCGAAARAWGLGAAESGRLRLAALLHDIGRVAVPNGILEKSAPLTDIERGRLQAHASETERILRRAPHFAALAGLAASAHERLDGSGYPRRVPAPLLGKPERLLAAADMLVAMTSDRPGRAGLTLAKAAAALDGLAAAGKIDRKAAALVLEAAGHHAAAASRANPAALTERETEVLLLLAKGLSNRAIAGALGVSPRTVQTHVMHVFDKTGIRSRSGAALFAVRELFAETQHFGG